jgi:sugar lactone lactonase YvrE
VADTRNYTIRLLAPAGTNWVVSTLAGGAGTNGFKDGTNRSALFNQPVGIAVDNSQNLFVADLANAAIRKITPVGTNWVTTTIASNLNSPTGISIDASNNLYLTLGDDTVRKLARESTNWVLSTVAGISTVPGSSDGTNGATFNYPHGIVAVSNDVLYVADSQNNTIREITGDGTVSTWAGLAGGPGSTDGFNDQARFNAPLGLAVDAGDNVYVADSQNNTIRQITPAGDVLTLAGVATNAPGDADGWSTNASFNLPSAVAVDSQQNLYVADYKNSEIRKLTQAGSQWQVSTLAGHANANYGGPITNVIGNTTYQSTVYYYTSNYVNYSGIITNIVNQTTTITVIAFTNVQVIRVTNIIGGVASVATNVLSTNLFELPPAPLPAEWDRTKRSL